MTDSTSWISRNSTEHVNRLVTTWLFGMAVLVAAMVVIGGITRLTGSGLSMVEWRPIAGTLPPLNKEEWERVFDLYKRSPEYQKYNLGMPMGEFKTIFFWEYIHRLWGRILGVFFTIPLIVFASFGCVPHGFGPRLILLFLLGLTQGIVGWWMVKSGLTEDASVSQYRLVVHLAVALVIFSLLLWSAFDLRDGRSNLPSGNALASLLLLIITILAGALVAGMEAGLMYNEFPFMGDNIIPEEYGTLGSLDPLENPASAQFHHRWLAVLTLSMILLLMRKIRCRKLIIRRNIVVAVVISQFLIGIVTLLHGVPVALGTLHQAGAVILLGSLLALLHGISNSAREAVSLD